MRQYRYRLPAGHELGELTDTLTGTVSSPHPLTDQAIRGQAIEQAPREYIHFGPIAITEGTES